MSDDKAQNRCGVCCRTGSELGNDQQWFIDLMGICLNCSRCYPSRICDALHQSVVAALKNMSPEKAELIFVSARELQREAEIVHDLLLWADEETSAFPNLTCKLNHFSIHDASLAAYGIKCHREYNNNYGSYYHVFPCVDEIERAAKNGIPLMVDPVSMKLMEARRCLEVLHYYKQQGFIFVPSFSCDNFDRTGRCLGHTDRSTSWL